MIGYKLERRDGASDLSQTPFLFWAMGSSNFASASLEEMVDAPGHEWLEDCGLKCNHMDVFAILVWYSGYSG